VATLNTPIEPKEWQVEKLGGSQSGQETRQTKLSLMLHNQFGFVVSLLQLQLQLPPQPGILLCVK